MILRLGKAGIICALQLNANGKIITAAATLKTGDSGVPGALIYRNILAQLTIAANKKMRRHLQPFEIGKTGIGRYIQLSQKQLLYIRQTKMAGRQTDIMDHQQAHLSIGPTIKMRRRAVVCLPIPAVMPLFLYQRLSPLFLFGHQQPIAANVKH